MLGVTANDILNSEDWFMTATDLDLDVATDDAAQALRNATVGVRFSRQVFGLSRKLDAAQSEVMADAFSASVKQVKGRKLLLDSKRPEYRKVSGRVLTAMAYWRSMTVPYEDVGERQ